MAECSSWFHDRWFASGKCWNSYLKHLLKEWAGKGVGHKRPVCHCVDVLYQVMKEVTVGTRQKDKTRQKQIIKGAAPPSGRLESYFLGSTRTSFPVMGPSLCVYLIQAHCNLSSSCMIITTTTTTTPPPPQINWCKHSRVLPLFGLNVIFMSAIEFYLHIPTVLWTLSPT